MYFIQIKINNTVIFKGKKKYFLCDVHGPSKKMMTLLWMETHSVITRVSKVLPFTKEKKIIIIIIIVIKNEGGDVDL